MIPIHYQADKDVIIRGHRAIEAPLLFDRLRYQEPTPVPDGLRLIHHSARTPNTIFVFEQEPQFRLISYRGEDYYLPTPWVVHFLTMQSNRMWVDRIMFSGRSIYSEDEPLWIPCLPNIYLDPVSQAKVCPNDDAKIKIVTKAQKLRLDLSIAGAIASFWSSNFNDDITAFTGHQPFVSFDATYGEEVGYRKGFLNWEKLNTDTILQVPWSYGYSIKDILIQMEWGGNIGELQPPPDYVALPPATVLTKELTWAALTDDPAELLVPQEPQEPEEEEEPEWNEEDEDPDY